MFNKKSQMDLHAEILGCKAKDKVTGFTGILTSLSFDLYGCVQFVISPPMDKEGNIPAGKWFDANRIEVLDYTPVMDQPKFDAGYIAEGRKGCAEKPMGKV